MKSQKLRTFLTLLGIIWGTVAVVLLLAFGEGLAKQAKKSMHGLGERIVILGTGRTSKVYQGFGKGREIRFVEEDVLLLKRQIEEIETICPEYYGEGTLRYKKNINTETGIIGIYPIYGQIRNIIPQRGGRFIDVIDLREKKKIVFMGDRLKNFLFQKEEAVGKYVYLNDVPFLVVGVLKEKTQTSRYTGPDAELVFIPASTFSSMFGDRYLYHIIYQTTGLRVSEFVKKKVHQILGKKYKFDPEDTEAIRIFDTTKFEKFLFYFFLGFKTFLGIVGTFTLIVGGIGAANIMNVVVEDRTKEIGIKMAVGAKRRFIMSQFIFETLLIIFIGGIIGFGISYLVTKVFPFFKVEEYVGNPTISFIVAIIATLVLGTVGLIAGYFPARRAANLNPVEALRD